MIVNKLVQFVKKDGVFKQAVFVKKSIHPNSIVTYEECMDDKSYTHIELINNTSFVTNMDIDTFQKMLEYNKLTNL